MSELTREEAKGLLLAHQHLLPPRTLSGEEGVLSHFARVKTVQFDPLNIVGRNPDLVLQSRIAGYRPEMLETLLYTRRSLIDGWEKMMSIYRTEDWPLFTRYRTRARQGFSQRAGEQQDVHARAVELIRKELKARGPLSSIDIKEPDDFEKIDWFWAPARAVRTAFDSMFAWGELVVHNRVNTRKVYDFASHHIPSDILNAPDPHPDDRQYLQYRVYRRLQSVGLLSDRPGDGWLAIPGLKAALRRELLQSLTESGSVTEVAVKGLPYRYFVPYTAAELEEKLEQLKQSSGAESLAQPRQAAFIAPLDNLMWDRSQIEELFGFRYRWEVYKPAADREYGYYVLPVLYGTDLIARFKAVQKDGALLVKHWWWEDGVVPDGEMTAALRDCLSRFRQFCGVDSVLPSPYIKKEEKGWIETAE